MKYEERFQRYLDGDADEHESVQIEEDLEKMRILSSYLDSRLDAQLFEEEERGDQAGKDDGLGRQVSRAVGRKLRRYAITASTVSYTHLQTIYHRLPKKQEVLNR